MARTHTLAVAAAAALLFNLAPAPLVAQGKETPPGPSAACTTDRQPPAVALTAPAAAEVVSSATYTLKATASDASGVGSVRFSADQLRGSARFSAEDTESPYELSWPVPAVCGESFAIAVEARDVCGNLTSAPARFVTVRRSCPAAPQAK